MSEEQRLAAGYSKSGISRRELLRSASAVAVLGGMGKLSLGETTPAVAQAPADKSKSFPDTFLWGCATAAH